MLSFMGMGFSISDDPIWFNADTGEVVQTGRTHHSKVFAHDPTILGISPDEVRFKSGGERYAMSYANVMLAKGWCRIDILNGRNRVLGQVEAQPAGTVSINAPNMSAADVAFAEALRRTNGRITKLVLVVSERATKDTSEAVITSLSGAQLQTAISAGLASASISGPPVRTSKMREVPRRGCPSGFGGRQ